MPLTRQDAQRLLHFCLGSDDSGSVDLADDGTALVTVVPADPMAIVRTFEAHTFDVALREAAAAGLLKASCVEKQIAFLSRSAEGRGAEADADALTTRRSIPDLFPKLVTVTAALLHELQAERGISSIYSGSAGRLLKRELTRQRDRTNLRRDRWLAIARDLDGALPPSLSSRLNHAKDSIHELVRGRAAIEEGRVAPIAVVSAYTAVNAALLALVDGTLVASAANENHSAALACVVLLYAKEKTGIERARIGATLAAAAAFSDEDRRILTALIAARSSYLHVFSATAPKAAQHLLARGLASNVSAEFARIESLILNGREAEIDVDARGWFTLASRQIDLFADVGAVALNLVAG